MNHATGGSACYPEQAFMMESQNDEEEDRAYVPDDEVHVVEEVRAIDHFQKAIQRMEAPKNRKQLRSFIGLVNFYRYMWRHRSQAMEPLTRLTGGKGKLVWTAEQQKAFEEVKRIVSKEVLLSFPDYSKEFHLYTDASAYQLGAVLMQAEKPIAFFSKKLNTAQKKYSVAEKEMLSVVETLQQFRNIVLGYPVVIHTDHKNLTHDIAVYKNSRVMRWRLAFEEFMPTLHFVDGEKNVVADALSRLSTTMMGTVCQSTKFSGFYFSSKLSTDSNRTEEDPLVQKLQRETLERLKTVFDDVGGRQDETAINSTVGSNHTRTKDCCASDTTGTVVLILMV
jgi:RNase H-like domain found in reverse transcriptase